MVATATGGKGPDSVVTLGLFMARTLGAQRHGVQP
jgi:hypothetical protein